jgi:hypothetical protein
MPSGKPPPCPGDPREYLLVETREGMHWRRKRGTVTPAGLNAGFKASSEITKIVAPACKRIRTALQPYLRGLQPGRLNNRLGTALRHSLSEKGRLDLSCLKGVELQREHPLEAMLTTPYRVSANKDTVRIEIPLEPHMVKPLNRLVTDYYFEAVLLYGEVGKEEALQTRSVESPLYPMGSKTKTTCVLELPLPQREDWCLLLKLSSLEGRELAVHPKHYRMKVVGGGG